MTREETISIMNVIVHMLEPQYDADRVENAVEMAIKALEQQPCEDVVSRQGVAEVLLKYAHSTEGKAFAEFLVSQINDLPSVTPQPKIGRWIEHFDESGKWYECDQCHTDWGGSVNYCPNCGAKMQGVEE